MPSAGAKGLNTLGFYIGLAITAGITTIYLSTVYGAKKCLYPQLQPDFQVEQYVGNWYEFAKSNNVPFE